VGSVPVSGSVHVTPTVSTRYTLTLTGSTGLTRRYSVNVTVPTSPGEISGTFTASPSTLPAAGGQVTLNWASVNATSARIDPDIGAVQVSGNMVTSVTTSTTFILTLSGNAGEQAYAADVVLTPSGTLTATPSTLPYGGGHVTLTWTSANATSATLDHGIGTVPTSGNTSVNVSASTAFTLTLSNSLLSEALVESVLVAPVYLPKDYNLQQNYPNPFNPTTNIVFDLPADAYVHLSVYNLLGQEIATLVDGFRSKNRYVIPFSSKGLSAGIYFYTLKAGDFTETRKMAVIK
jgi:hypothetical protein